MICVSIGRTRTKMVVLEHRALAERGAELVELRLDWLARAPDLVRLLKDKPTPVVITCRRQADRGHWRGTEEQRMAVLREAIVTGVDYVDLEDDIAASVPRYGKTKRIVSHHNFDETPRDLADIHKRMTGLNPDIVKLVTMANSPSDCVRMMKLVHDANKTVPTVGFCMGELGVPSRILCGRYGSPFTFATFSREREMAPGQISFDEMKNIYHFDDINASTEVYGVLGDPIGHSLSPLLHNAAMRECKLNAVYVPIRVSRDDLGKTLEKFDALGFKGYSVTIPHKQSVLEKAKNLDQATQDIGAANTLYRDAKGQWNATNTDYVAALESIRIHLAPDADPTSEWLRGREVLMLGAGGVARAIGLGIKRHGGKLTIANRTPERAVALAAELGCQRIDWENRATIHCSVLINCTPVGMHPNVDETPYPGNWIEDGMLVFDTIYNPENTLLIKETKQRRCKSVSGMEMFVRQAAAQFELFTNRPAPLDLMRETLRRGISAVGSG
ncbi:MAG: shikimate dehydrogenase [Planctomycetota bacterium]|nr:shikimate dehydrogenase [Planctomycetota bacterium]